MKWLSLYLPAIRIYALIGGASALVEWAVFAGLLNLLGVHYVVAAIGGFVFATLVNYVLSRRYGFLRRGEGTRREIVTIYIVSLVALGINLLATIALVELANAHVFLAKVLGTGFGFVCNFAGRQFRVFD